MAIKDSSDLADYLRSLLRDEPSLRAVALATGIPQPTLNDFVHGRKDGTFSDLRLSAAEMLMEFYGLTVARSNKKVAVKENRTMRLARELKMAGVRMESPDFKKYLVSWLIEWYPDQSIDWLVCDPKDAMEYCQRVRAEIENDKLIDYVILKALMNMRKASLVPAGADRRGRKNLKTILVEAGCTLPPDQFESTLIETLPAVCRNKTIDDFCCYPQQTQDYCQRLRRSAEFSNLTNRQILKALMNCRKTVV